MATTMSLLRTRHLALVIATVFLVTSLIAGLVTGVGAAAAGMPKPSLKKTLAKKYPRQPIVNSCEGSFLGRKVEMVAALHDQPKKQFRIVWVKADGDIQELQSVPEFSRDPGFELQCLDAKQAKERDRILTSSEGIHNFLKIPEGAGALCYFTDNTTTQCWSVEANDSVDVKRNGNVDVNKAKEPGRLIEAGGWQT